MEEQPELEEQEKKRRQEEQEELKQQHRQGQHLQHLRKETTKPDIRGLVSPRVDLDAEATEARRRREARVQHVLSCSAGNLREDYEVGCKLGEGHFGSTYEVVQRATGRRYAMKRISKTRLLMLGTPLSEVKREVGMLYHLAGHPNIVEVVGAYEDARSVCIVMELCGGGELYDRIIAKGHYSERDAARLIQTIVSVVDFCHSLGVVHRDLKPENFLFARAGDDSALKAIDFGLSIFYKKGESITAGLAGSPLYLAPEMIASNGQRYGPEVDVWSAGVIMYMLLSGYCPFPTDLPSMDDLFRSILFDDIDYDSHPWPLISASAKHLLRGMLNRDPTLRLSASQVLHHPWICTAGVAPDTPMDQTVVDRLRLYAATTHIRKLATRVVAEHMTEEEILGMREIFRQLDTDGNGTISLEEMRIGFQRMGELVCEAELKNIFAAIDVDDNKCIDMHEFFAATLGLSRLIKEENLACAFEYFDKDGSGFITADELRQVCQEFLPMMTDLNLDEMMAEVDVNKDNRIDYKEFVTMMHKRQGQASSDFDAPKSHSLGKDKTVLRSVTTCVERMRRSLTM